PELALEMVRAARERGSTHQWIGADEAYGNNAALTNALEDAGETFLMDVKSTTHVWTQPPLFETTPAQAQDEAGSGEEEGNPAPRGRGRPRTHKQPRIDKNSPAPIEASALAASSFASESRLITIRQSTRGPLRAPIWVCRVWTCDPQQPRARERLLIVRQ